MKNSLTKPVRYGKIIAMEAVLLTVGIHCVFFLLFSVPKVRQEQTEKENTSVTLWRFDTSDKEGAELENYIVKYSPLNFSNGQSPLSFSRFIPVSKRQSVSLPELGRHDMQFTAAVMPIGYGDIPAGKIARNVLPRRETGRITPETSRRIEYPFAVSNSGMVIALPLSVDELRMANEFPLNCGVYKLLNNQESNIMPRLVLLQSSGRRVLDRLSMRLLYAEMKRLSDCADGEIFTVHYRDHDAGGGEL